MFVDIHRLFLKVLPPVLLVEKTPTTAGILSSSILPNASFEYGYSIIFHEALHAIWGIESPQSGHVDILSEKYFNSLKGTLTNKGINPVDASALVLLGVSDLMTTTAYTNLLQKQGLTIEDVKRIGLEYREGKKGKKCQI
jgi:hypothetical protein